MTSPSNGDETIGILYAGEMGTAVGRLLLHGGFSVITVVEGRSDRTRTAAEQARLPVAASLIELARRADLVLSLVPPSAALQVAQQYRDALPRHKRPDSARRRPPRYVDLNSIAPETACAIDLLFRDTPVEFADGAIHGLAVNLPQRGTFYLSGAAAPVVARTLARVFRVKVLSDTIGSASALRMLISAMTKGIIALFLEAAVTARRAGLLDELLLCYAQTYPGVMAVVDRTLPTYPRHAARRADEMSQAAQMQRRLGLEPRLVTATQALIEAFARLELSDTAPGEAVWSVPEVIEAAFARELLRPR